CWYRRRPLSGSSCKRSGSIRSARRLPPSTSTMCSGRCRRAPTPDQAVPRLSCLPAFPSPANAGEGKVGRGQGNETRMARQATISSPPSDPADAVRDFAERGHSNEGEIPRIAADVQDFYERYPYPPPVDSLGNYRRSWENPQKRRAEHHLLWPALP